MPPPFDPNASTRERFEAKVAPTGCAGCHSTFTPYGMALEAYDGLARFRTDERLIDDDGQEIGTVPVDTAVDAEIDGQTVPLAGPVEMSEALADSQLAAECFARHYFRYTYRRAEQPGDECSLAAVLGEVAPEMSDSGSLAGALRQIAMGDAFKQRVVGP
jgi:hypothetical protein